MKNKNTMENEVPNWAIAVFLVVLLTVVVVTVASIVRDDTRRTKEKAARVKACEILNPQFGEWLVVKEGFYKGVPGIALEKNDQSVKIQIRHAVNIVTLVEKEITFYCSDLERPYRDTNE